MQNDAANGSKIIDPLTGLRTPRALPSALDETMAAILLDIDGLRFVNDELGHLAGDDVLRRLGRWLAQEAELLAAEVFRIAGDKFLLLLRGRTIHDATTIANTLVSRCTSLRLPNASRAAAPDALAISAVVFIGDPDVPVQLRAVIEKLTNDLYRAELAAGRTHSNVVLGSLQTI